MSNKICIYNSKLFLVLDSYLLAYSYNKCPKSENERFSECLKITFPVKFISIIDTKLYVIDNYFTGLKSLLILLYDTNERWSIFIYNETLRKKLQQIIVPDFSLRIKDNFFISDGPTFLFHSRNTFHVFPLSYHHNKYTDFTFPPLDYKEFKVLQFKCVEPFKSSFQPCLYLLIISCNFSSQQSIKMFIFSFDVKNPATRFQQISIKSFFPQCYESILKAVEIIKATPYLKTNFLNIENMEWKETVSVICTNDECLIFANSELQYCCKLTLPLINAMHMKTDFMNSISSDDNNLMLTFENNFAFFLEIKQNEGLRVVKQWTDIETTFVGDILMKGSKQMILLKQADLNSWQNNIILYDMLSFMPIDVLYHSSVPDNCLKATISGLEKKLQIGKSAIRDVEFEISQKSSATVDALIRLNEYKVNAESLKLSHTFQQSLVDLILSKDENKTETNVSESEPSVKLLDEKHCFVDNHWIISLCFLNERERCICYPSIKVIKRNNQLACFQKLFVCSSDTDFFPSDYGREIDAKTKFYIVLTLKNLVFPTEDDIFLILSWYNGSTIEFDNEVFAKQDKKVLTQSQICVQIRITSSDIFKQHNHKGISSSSDLLFTRALQQKTKLCVSSLHSDISKLEDILMKNVSTPNCLYLLENSSTKYLIFNDGNSPLFGVHFIIMKSMPSSVEIGAFSRNGNELCLLVHYLYQHLPKDVMISPRIKFKDEYTEVKKNFALSMKNEIDLLITSFNAHNISDEMRKSYVKLMSSETVGTLTVSKIDYHRIRTVLVKKECITDILFKSIFQDANSI